MDTGAGKYFISMSLLGADLTTRGPPTLKSVGGFIGGGVAPIKESYVYSFDTLLKDGSRIKLPPFRSDYCPTAKTNVVPLQTWVKLIGGHSDFGGGGSSPGALMWMKLEDGLMIEFTYDSRNMPWLAVEPSVQPAGSVLTVSLSSATPEPTPSMLASLCALRLRPAVHVCPLKPDLQVTGALDPTVGSS